MFAGIKANLVIIASGSEDVSWFEKIYALVIIKAQVTRGILCERMESDIGNILID
jgi:hypothetical protein